MTSAKEMLERLNQRIGTRLNNWLVEMKPGHDDSIVGFNEAWDIVREVFKEELRRCVAESAEPVAWQWLTSVGWKSLEISAGKTIQDYLGAGYTVRPLYAAPQPAVPAEMSGGQP